MAERCRCADPPRSPLTHGLLHPTQATGGASPKLQMDLFVGESFSPQQCWKSGKEGRSGRIPAEARGDASRAESGAASSLRPGIRASPDAAWRFLGYNLRALPRVHQFHGPHKSCHSSLSNPVQLSFSSSVSYLFILSDRVIRNDWSLLLYPPKSSDHHRQSGLHRCLPRPLASLNLRLRTAGKDRDGDLVKTMRLSQGR